MRLVVLMLIVSVSLAMQQMVGHLVYLLAKSGGPSLPVQPLICPGVWLWFIVPWIGAEVSIG